ncbi:MAG: GMP synthase subunit A [Candidatus Bathyarchaeota archaeon]|jgi:GMP synthase (glutamine-hydrolysing)|nr:GMP synthase subunit A [Candidatus Bathyarchaeota archaeon]
MSDAVRVYVVDNGGQWTHRIWRVLREIGCETRIIPNVTPVDQIDADGLVLSGGAPRVAWESPRLGNCTDYFDRFSGPILGECLGMQLMAIHFGGSAGPAEIPEFGLARMQVLEEDDLFRELPREFLVWESHNDEVKDAPGFDVLAASENCKIQAIKHREKPLYGVQFHPEVNNTEYGYEILRNFVEVVVCRKRS